MIHLHFISILDKTDFISALRSVDSETFFISEHVLMMSCSILISAVHNRYMVLKLIVYRYVMVITTALAAVDMCTDILWIDKLSVSEYRIGNTFFNMAAITLGSILPLNVIVLVVTICKAQRRRLIRPKVWSDLSVLVVFASLVSILHIEMIVLFPWTRREYGSSASPIYRLDALIVLMHLLYRCNYCIDIIIV